MEIKVEKGQFRWKLLVFVFFVCTALIYPVAQYLYDKPPITAIIKNMSEFNKDIVIGVFCAILATIPVGICVFLQKTWPFLEKIRITLFILLCFVLMPQKFLWAIFSYFPGPFILLYPFFPIIIGLLFYRFILIPCHQRYGEVEEIVEYKILSVRSRIMLWVTYIALVSIAVILAFVLLIIALGPPSKVELSIQFTPLKYALFLAIPTQLFICMEEWSSRTKIINILIVELVFIGVGFIVSALCYFSDQYSLIITPSIVFAGGVLLRHIFIKSCFDALERKE